MRAKELAKLIKFNEFLSKGVCEEIIQKLTEYDEFKKIVYETIEPMEGVFEFLFSVVFDEEDSEGSIDREKKVLE